MVTNNEQEGRNPSDNPLEMRLAALEDKLAGMTVTEDELEVYKKVARVMGWRGNQGSPGLASQGGCISGCISPCSCSDCGCIEGCVSARASGGCISGCVSPCSCSDCGCVEGCVSARASGCISGCVSPCSCSDCGCISGCVDYASQLRRGFNPMQQRFGRLGF